MHAPSSTVPASNTRESHGNISGERRYRTQHTGVGSGAVESGWSHRCLARVGVHEFNVIYPQREGWDHRAKVQFDACTRTWRYHLVYALGRCAMRVNGNMYL